MRTPVITDHVWVKGDAEGTPWIVLSVGNGEAELIRGSDRTSARLSDLKIVGADQGIEPQLDLYPSLLLSMAAFLKAHPQAIAVLDLHPKHQEQVRAAVAEMRERPQQAIATGATVRITVDGGKYDGCTGVILAWDERTDSYVVDSPEATYTLVYAPKFLEVLP